MPIIFAQKQKNQKTLIIVFVVTLLITAIVIWQGFFKKEKTTGEYSFGGNVVLPQEEIKIDFNVLKNPLLKELQSFSEIEPLEESTTTIKGKIEMTGKKGRENPFLPH
jgi:hypothetical protein